MDLPEPGVPKMAHDPFWYDSLRSDLDGPQPNGYAELIPKVYKRAERNSKRPKPVYPTGDPRGAVVELAKMLGQHAEIHSDKVDALIANENPESREFGFGREGRRRADEFGGLQRRR